VDCSVTPHVSWRSHAGDPAGRGGPDFSDFPERAYFIDPADIARACDSPQNASPLLEVPLTVLRPMYSGTIAGARSALSKAGAWGGRVARRLYPDLVRLVPNGRNRRHLALLLDTARRDGRDHVEFVLHSSELMPGGSPTFPDQRSVAALYGDLEAIFATGGFEGMTLATYYDRFAAAHGCAQDARTERRGVSARAEAGAEHVGRVA
jgi:hypothetical protein